MTVLQTGVLYAVELGNEGEARPARVLDTRTWRAPASVKSAGFVWQIAAPGIRSSYESAVGPACLYWSRTDDPDGQALLDFPWEPLPDDDEAAEGEVNRRAADVGRSREAGGTWMCLRPVARDRIVCRWEEYDQLLERRRVQAEEDRREHGRRLLVWDEVNRRLTSLGLRAVEPQPGAYRGAIELDQLITLLDRAERQ